MPSYLQRPVVGYAAAVFGVVAIALLISPFYPDVVVLTASNMLLLVVLGCAITWGMGPALLASILSALYLNYFFVPPLHSLDLRINGSPDEIALLAFTVTSVGAGRLFANAQQRARENKRLYDQLLSISDKTTRLEVIRRSEQFKTALLDSVTHDLRTPLTSIKAASTAIIDIRKNSPSPLHQACLAEDDLLGIIVKQSDRLNRFIEELIEMAGFDARGNLDNAVSVPVEEIIGAAIARAEDALRGCRVTVKCFDDLRAAVNAKAIAQVLFSLLENSGKYGAPGTSVWVTAGCDGEGLLRIAVEDEGPGIPAALRDKVFEKFFRGEASESPESQVDGLGLGLAIARNIVEAHGGQIWVEEREAPGSGARFVFKLPSGRRPESIPAASEVAE